MKCPFCNFENEKDFAYCPMCGNAQQRKVNDPDKSRVLSILKDQLFLIMCILVSASCFGALSSGGIPLINILLTVFLWLAYAAGRRGVADAEHLRCVSGTVYADYVVNSVVFWLYVVMSILAVLLWLFFPNIIRQTGIFGEICGEFFEFPYFSDIIGMLSHGIVKAIISSALDMVVIFISMLGLKRIHRFLKSLYMSIQTEDIHIEFATDASKWLIALAVVNMVSAANSILNFNVSGCASDGCIAVAMIIAAVLVRKHILETEV